MTDINELIKQKKQAQSETAENQTAIKTEADNNQKLTVGIYGIGLIGGSFAKAYSAQGHRVLADDNDTSMLKFAKLSGAVTDFLTEENLPTCDLILLCTPPNASVEFLEKEGCHIGKKPLVMDCCGTKRVLTKAGMEASEKYGFTFVGGHPMAGTQFAGFKHAQKDMFEGAPMVIVPPVFDDIELLSRVKDLLEPAGFGRISVTTAENHDETIAFTSQLAHVVSSSYIKSPTAQTHTGFSAGSYKDMTRVARLNPVMWSELFLDNKDNILNEIDYLMQHLAEYRKAIAEEDRDSLIALLDEGRKRKLEIDG